MSYCIDDKKLHSKALRTIDGDGLVIDDCKQVLISTHGNDMSIKRNTINIISSDIQNLDFALTGHSDPIIGTSYSSDFFPVFFPLFLPFVQVRVPFFSCCFEKLHSIIHAICIDYNSSVHIAEGNFLVNEKKLGFGIRLFSLILNTDLVLILMTLNQIPGMICK